MQIGGSVFCLTVIIIKRKKKKSTIFIERLFPVVQKHFTYSYKNNNKELLLNIDASISLHFLPRKVQVSCIISNAM